jgi:putative lipoic acid-binding regulatory protein
VERPEITYPCAWTYRIVGTDADEIRALVTEVLVDRPHELRPSRESRKGNYVSLVLEVAVRDEADRDEIFRALMDGACVKIVV